MRCSRLLFLAPLCLLFVGCSVPWAQVAPASSVLVAQVKPVVSARTAPAPLSSAKYAGQTEMWIAQIKRNVPSLKDLPQNIPVKRRAMERIQQELRETTPPPKSQPARKLLSKSAKLYSDAMLYLEQAYRDHVPVNETVTVFDGLVRQGGRALTQAKTRLKSMPPLRTSRRPR